MEIRYFAGAAEAAGTRSESLEVGESESVADVVARLVDGRERLARVATAASLLLDGRTITDRSVPARGARLDVLPPFAGG